MMEPTNNYSTLQAQTIMTEEQIKALDAAGKRGAVNLMTSLIEEGSGDLDAQGFAAARDALAADFSFSSGEDSVSVSARFLSENREQAMALLHQALVNPLFDQASFERAEHQSRQLEKQ